MLANRVLKKTDEGAAGDDTTDTTSKPSLLVYSSSITLPVKLQCRLVGDKSLLARDDKFERPREWHNLSGSQIASIRAPISFGPDEHGVSPEALAQGYYFCYRPYSADFIRTTSDARTRNSNREKLFGGLGTIGVIGGFLTSTNALKGSGDAVLNQYGNVFVPALRKILPDQSEFYRENIGRYGMKEFENIPYGEQVQRFLFLPSQHIDGVLPGYQVRITSVYTNSLAIRAAAIDDTNMVAGQTNRALESQ